MSFTRISNSQLNSRGATTLPNQPQISAAALKEEFDAPAKQIVAPAVNNLMDELEASSAASNIGITAPTGRTGSTVKGVIDDISTDLKAVEDVIPDLQADEHTHANKALLDDYDQSNADIKQAIQDDHTHANKALLDDYDQSNADIKQAIQDDHTHSNKTVLDALSDNGGSLEYNGSPIGGGNVNDAYKKFKVGTTEIIASGEDTIELVAGTNVTLTPDPTNKRIVIEAAGGGGGGGTGDMSHSDYDSDYSVKAAGGIKAFMTGDNTSYDNTSSGMTASNVQDAIDELNSGKEDALIAGNGISIDSSNNISANLVAGSNVTITPRTGGALEISASGGGGGGLLPHLNIHSEAGATVTVVCPDSTVITPTQVTTTLWECDVPGYGTYVVHSVLTGQGDATLSVVVDDVKIYDITDNHFDFTLNLTAPSGSTILITDGVSETYSGSGTGSSQPFVVHQASTQYTVTVTLDGNSNSDTFTSDSTTGQSTSMTIAFGTISVTVDADFITAGATITCTKGAKSCTAKAAASTVYFYPPETGTWEIAGTISPKTYTVDAEVTSLSTPVSVSLKTKAVMYAFASCTDQQLADMLESYYNGAYDATDIALLKSTYMPIGAKRTIHLAQMAAGDGVSETHFDASGADYEYTIIGHEHDDLVTQSSGGKTKALLTLQQDRILYKNTTDGTYSSNYPATSDGGGYMNSTNTNVGGWKNCVRRAWCNNTFKNALPAAIQALLKTVVKVTSEGNQSSTLENTNDDVFFLSEQEIFGAKTYSAGNEGSQYEYYTTAANIAKKPSYQSYVSAYVWERSPYLSDATSFCSVNTSAAANYDVASIANGLAPAFCI